jgi:hypothetical protein
MRWAQPHERRGKGVVATLQPRKIIIVALSPTVLLLVALSLLLLGELPRCRALPSHRFKVPNGARVPCPPGVAGCDTTDHSSGVCPGVGHATCAGGSLPLNAFGEDLKTAGFAWWGFFLFFEFVVSPLLLQNAPGREGRGV